MASTFNFQQILADEILIRFLENNVLVDTAWRNYESATTDGDTGGSVKVRLPNNFLVGRTLDVSGSSGDVVEKYVDLTVDQIANVVMNVNSLEKTFKLTKKLDERTLVPASVDLAETVDADLAYELFVNSYLTTGTAGSQPSTYKAISDTEAFMDDMAIPDGGMRYGVVSPSTYSSLRSFADFQNSYDASMTKAINRKGDLGNINNFNMRRSVSVVKHTAGIGDSTATPATGLVDAGLVKTAITSGNTMVVKGLNATDTGTFLKGDKITLENVYGTHPTRLTSTGREFQITVLEDAAAVSAGGEVTITFSPAIDASATSPYKNIAGSSIPVDTALHLVTANSGLASATKQPYEANIFYHNSALIFASPQLAMLDRDDGFSSKNGISLRTHSDSVFNTSVRGTRIDTQWGRLIQADRSIVLVG